jgi:N12 class adenine-specific DNA methylase
MIIAAQETRRTGRIDGTALFAVPGNMVEQFARDYLKLYPAARVLTPHGATQKDAVREFAARLATGACQPFRDRFSGESLCCGGVLLGLVDPGGVG